MLDFLAPRLLPSSFPARLLVEVGVLLVLNENL